MTKVNQRIVFADYIRVIACFLVMLVHSSEFFYNCSDPHFVMLATESNRFWVSFYDGTLSRICVPLFMIVSAFLLVPMKPGVSMTQFYKRRFSRILPPLIIFSIIYCFLPALWGFTTIEQGWKDFSTCLLNFPPAAAHLWFMYALIGVYIIIPVISPWLEKASAKDERTFLALFLLSSFIPFLRRFVIPELWGECFWNEFDALWYCSGFIGYLVMAHYIRFHIKWNRAKRIQVGASCFIIGGIFTGCSSYFMAEAGEIVDNIMYEWAWGFCTPNVILATFGAFLMFSCISKPKTPALIAEISRLSFGMYLCHMLFLAPIAVYLINGDAANPLLPVWATIPLTAISTYICTIIATKIISYLPGSKYIIGC